MVQPAQVTDRVRTSAAQGDWVERVGRTGLVARGVLYALLGVVAFRVAWGDRSEGADKGGALQLLEQQPLGDALLLAVAGGLACYALWCLVEAFLEREDEDDAKGTMKVWGKRAKDIGRAIAYGLVLATAISVLRHDPQAGSDATQRSMTATVLGWGTAGQVLVGAVGAGFVVAGLWNAYRAFTTKFEDDLAVDASPSVRRGVTVVGVAGLLGRAVAFVAIGWFVLDAAVHVDPNRPLGLDESLATLAGGSFGPIGISVVALGLLLYGVFSFAEARWKQLT